MRISYYCDQWNGAIQLVWKYRNSR